MGNLLMWLTAPPIVAVPVFYLTRVMSTEDGSHIPLGIWILVIISVLVLTILYIWASSSKKQYWLLPLQFVAQGGFMHVVAIHFGALYLAWIGILLILIGLILSGAIFFRDDNITDPKKHSTSHDMLASYPFPACVSDKNGSLLSISDGLVQLIGKNRNELREININSFIPPSGRIKFGNKYLHVFRQESENKVWYMLEEEDISQQKANSVLKNPEMLIKDLETEIFSKGYCKLRTEEEIARIKRYKRWAIFMLIRISFIGINEENSIEKNENKQSESEFFSSFCIFVKNVLRNCDTISRVDEFSIFIILPETLSEEPVNEVIKKILSFSNQLSDIINQQKRKISPNISHIFYNASSQDMSFDDILFTLNNTLSNYDYT